MNAPMRRAAMAAALMLSFAVGAYVLTPRERLSSRHAIETLDTLIPQAFGDWRIDRNVFAGVVNPQTVELLNQVYTQTLTRTYVNSRGERIMLSLAYGDDQTDSGVQLHYPEICYPAQGFQVKSNATGVLTVPQGAIPVRRLETVMNRQRFEPVTYWTVIGEQVAVTGVEKKLIELRYGLRGQIVDGLLFRVSSINTDSAQAFALQQQFVADLLNSSSPERRIRLSGLR